MRPGDVARSVRDKYADRLGAVNEQIAKDAAANPKAPPDKDLTDQRWRLQGYLRAASALIIMFEEEGL